MADPDPLSPHAAPPAASRADALAALAPALHRTARRLTQHADDASAVTLQAIGAVLEEGAEEGAVRAASFRALWHAVEERWRLQGHVPRGPGPDSPEQILDGRLAMDEGELDRLLISRLDASPEVDTALRQLGERERFVILLIDVEELTREEAAHACGCAVDDVALLLLSARTRMFGALVDYAQRASGRHRLGDM